MTLYGPDVSSYQGNVNWGKVKSEGFDFAIVKCTEGNNYLNPYFVSQIDGAKAAGLLVAVYHYIRSDCSAASQSAYFASKCDKSWPVILDHEANSGGEALNHAVHQNLTKRGYKVVLNYMPEWYWQQIGQPRIRNGPLWKSWYPNMTPGYASSIYAGCPESAWSGYGGQRVALRQFTSSAKIAGQTMDCSAFEGTRNQLAALFGGQTGDEDMDAEDKKTLADLKKLMSDHYVVPWRDKKAKNPDYWLGTTIQSIWDLVTETAQRGRRVEPTVNATAEKVGAPVEVDTEAIVAGVLAGLPADKIAAAIPDELAAQVADELGMRLAGGSDA